MTLSPDHPLREAKTMVAKDLLDRCENPKPGRLFDQRNIAAQTGLDWNTVHNCLESLCNEGAIKLDRNRIIINKYQLQRCV